MGILLGVLTALTWGGSDFLARFATERMGTLRTLLYMQFIGFILLTLALPWLGGWGHLADGSGWQPWAWGALAGCVNAVSTLGLYRSFEIGKMAVVAPLSASYPVLTVTLSLLSAERLARHRYCLHHDWRAARRRRRESAGHQRCRSHAAQRQRNRLGARFSGRIWVAILAARQSCYPSRGRPANRVDDSNDLHRDRSRRDSRIPPADKAPAQHARNFP